MPRELVFLITIFILCAGTFHIFSHRMVDKHHRKHRNEERRVTSDSSDTFALNITAPNDNHCHWINNTHASWLLPSRPRMCIRGRDDILSNVIHDIGRWPDCDDLIHVLLKPYNPNQGIFVDVGANIGACSFLVAGNLFVTHAFEPQPDNLKYFRSTLGYHHSDFRDLIHLHTVALGDQSGESVIYRQQGNAGNSVVGVVHPDDPNNKNDYILMQRNAELIRISTLDDELWPDNRTVAPKILVMKLDVQGFEVKVLQGAKRLLAARAVLAIKTEMAPAFLRAQGTSPLALCHLLAGAGFAFQMHASVDQCAAADGELVAILV